MNGDLRDEFRELILIDDHEAARRPRAALLDDERLRPLIGTLWNSTDTMLGELCEAIGVPRGSTYAQGVRSLGPSS